MKTSLALLLAAFAASSACASSESSDRPGQTDAAVDAAPPEAGLDVTASDTTTSCSCAPGLHNDAIIVLSDDTELWSYSPTTNQLALIAKLPCADVPYSLAVDQRGLAWVSFSSHDLLTFDVNAADGQCVDPGFVPDQAGFGLFGMGFSVASEQDRCEKLYLHSYSGSGPFNEGPDRGALGVLDPASLAVTKLATIDYDGGELTGTGDGRLFAFAGVNPAKLVEYDKSTGATLATIPLTGFSKTNASAFAFFAGAFYLFTEAPPAGCDACLDQNCKTAADACKADPECAAELSCAIELGDITDDCGGAAPVEIHNCLSGPCLDACLPSPSARVSRVHRFDPASQALTLVNPSTPIRIVGAGTSTCVQYRPR